MKYLKNVLIILTLLLMPGCHQRQMFNTDSVNNIKLKEASNTDKDALLWIEVPGTNIDYPVIPLSYEKYYLDQKDYNHIYTNNITDNLNNNYLMIFGHNMKNLSAKPLIIAKDHSRFEQLLSFYYQSFISSHQFILLSTKNDNYIYKIFAVTFRKNDSILLTNPKNDQEMQALIDESLDNSLFKIDTKIDTDDKVLALITCTRILGARSDIRFMVLAKRVTSNKDLYYSTVKINKLKNMGIKE